MCLMDLEIRQVHCLITKSQPSTSQYLVCTRSLWALSRRLSNLAGYIVIWQKNYVLSPLVYNFAQSLLLYTTLCTGPIHPKTKGQILMNLGLSRYKQSADVDKIKIDWPQFISSERIHKVAQEQYNIDLRRVQWHSGIKSAIVKSVDQAIQLS